MNTALPVGFEGQLESKHSNIQLSVERSGADIFCKCKSTPWFQSQAGNFNPVKTKYIGCRISVKDSQPMKYTKESWIQKGLDLLNSEGADAVMVDHLCAKLKVTKGSFYHYFDGVDEYITLVVKLWEKGMQTRLDALSKSGLAPEERLNGIAALAFNHSGRLELGMRAWALHNKSVNTILTKLEKRRLELLTSVFIDFKASKKRARQLAEMTHTSWIGIQVCQNGEMINKEQAIRLIKEAIAKEL